MNNPTFDWTAKTTAAFAIEMETSAALRGLVLMVGEDKARMLWAMGYMKGAEEAMQEALEIHRRAA